MIRFYHIRATLAALLMLGMSIEASASGLIRLTDRDDLYGWEAVGRVDISGKGYCTGVLIAPNLVLTAAHCVYDNQDNPVPAGKLQFRAGLRDGVAIAERSVARVVAHKGYDPKLPYNGRVIRFDAALLELAGPISSSIAAPFKLHEGAQTGQRVSVVSYGRGRDAALSWQRDCGLLDRGQGLMVFDCNITFGSSGAPVFSRTGRRARILSLISGSATGANPPRAYGMDLAVLVTQLKRDLRALPQAPLAQAKTRRVKIGQSSGISGAKFSKPPKQGGS